MLVASPRLLLVPWGVKLPPPALASSPFAPEPSTERHCLSGRTCTAQDKGSPASRSLGWRCRQKFKAWGCI